MKLGVIMLSEKKIILKQSQRVNQVCFLHTEFIHTHINTHTEEMKVDEALLGTQKKDQVEKEGHSREGGFKQSTVYRYMSYKSASLYTVYILLQLKQERAKCRKGNGTERSKVNHQVTSQGFLPHSWKTLEIRIYQFAYFPLIQMPY